MKKTVAFSMVAMMLLCMLVGCTAGSKEADGDTLVIGGIGPLTGDYATYGISVKQGAQLAVEEINQQGGVNGIKFELKFEDDQVDAEMAVNAYNKLMDNGMDVSLGAVTSGACIAVTEQVKKDGLLMITPSGSQLECVQYPSCFRICFADPYQGVYAADVIAGKKIATKIAILYDKSNDYSNGLMESFVGEAAKVGLEIVSSQAFTDQSNTDFSAQLQAISTSGAELIFLPIYAQEAAYILTQAQQMGMTTKFFGCDGMDGIFEKIGETNISATEGLMLLSPFAADSKDAKTVAFVTAYEKMFSTTPDQFAADGYDAVYTIKAAMEKCGAKPTDADFNEKMVAAMFEITVDGVTGSMQWDAQGEPSKIATALIVKDGKYVAYDN